VANVHRVLLAEDNKINQVVAAGALKKLGYVVDIVDGGSDAVAACLHARFDAVLMDVMMPDMDGYEATSKIRENEVALGTSPVPVIGLSARAMAGDREIALAAGMDDYLTKPLRINELEQTLARWIPQPADATS
jgi:two-component system sensor histidine kinase/response regulator